MAFLDLNKKFELIKKAYKHNGLTKLLKKSIYVRTEELINEIDINAERRVSLKNELEIQSMEEKHMEDLLEIYKQADIYDDDPRDLISRYFKNNCKCFIATRNNNFIGHTWWGNNKMRFEFDSPDFRFIRDEIELKDDDAYMWDFFIVPKERSGGYAFEFMSKVLLALNKEGYNRVTGCVPLTPVFRSARWIYSLLGAKEVKRIVVRKIFAYMLVFKGKRLYFNKHGFHELCWTDDGTKA